MNLVNYINSKCPVGFSHSHCLGENPKNNKTECALCQNHQKIFGKCINFKKITITTPSIDEITTLKFCLTKSDKYYLPVEIQDIVIKFCKYREIKYPVLKLDKEGIDHMTKCLKCTQMFVNWYQNEACNRHMLPRDSESDNIRIINII
ncbi:hypothetical protein CPAV1605_1435 [seawater metagenome]|uniref:Uncharacterized protein n=1 Tax=seawater metagenome TaxID=1561972 RepID=A0A5E8CMJ8_9ZZZZ